MPETQIDAGAPEKIGTVIGAIIAIGCYLLVLWPVVRHWVVS